MESRAAPPQQENAPFDGDPPLPTGDFSTAEEAATSSSDESSAYLLILELIMESQISQSSDLDSSADLFSPEIVDLDDEGAAERAEGLKEPVLFYAQGGEPGSGHCFFLDNCTDEELTAVRLVVPDVPGILTSATTAIETEGLDIVHCQMEQLEGLRAGWAYIECYITNEEGERVEGWGTVKQLCQQIRSKLGERLKITRRRSHYRPNHLRRTSINTRHQRSQQQGGAPAPVGGGGPGSSQRSHARSLSLPGSAALPESPFLSSQDSSAPQIPSMASLPSAFDEYRPTVSLSASSSASSHSTAIRDPGSFEAQASEQPQPSLMARTVSGVMRPSLEVVPAHMSIQEAFKLMTGKKRSCLVVDNGEGEEPGIVTKRDFLTKQTAEHMQLTAGDVQTRPIAFVRSTDLLTMASELMSKLRVKRLLVKEPQGDVHAGEPPATSQQYIGEISEDTLVDATVFASTSGDSEATTPADAPPCHSGRGAGESPKILSQWEISMSDISLISRVGQGSFGEVWHGKWNGTDVAVKRVWGLMESIEEAASAAQEFDREISLLSRIRHPNVVMFLGACSVAPDVALVMEFCPRGTLYRLLHRNSTSLPLLLRVRMATHVARGMLALHSARPKVIHRDLKSANLLVGSSYEIKVCDFGLSRTMENAAACLSNRSQSSFGTVEYAAPEVLRGEPYSEKCDVWSFGVVLWELLMRKRPYSDSAGHSVSIIAGVSLGRLSLPTLPVGVATSVLQELIVQCCQQLPTERPSFAEILMTLEQEATNLKQLGGGGHLSTSRRATKRAAASSVGTSPLAPPGGAPQPAALALPHLGSGAELVSPFADMDSPFAQMTITPNPQQAADAATIDVNNQKTQ